MQMNLTKHSAYLLGVYMGDGSIWNNGLGSRVFGLCAQDKDFVENVAYSISELTGKTPSIQTYQKKDRKTPYFRCQVSHNDLISFLIEHSHAKTIVPKIILDAEVDLKKEYIAGLLDSEGYVAFSKRHMYGGHEIFDMRIGFSICDPWIYEFREMLIHMGIRCSPVYRYDASHTTSKVQYRFTIDKQSFIANGLYFKIRRKQSRIDHYKALFLSSTTRRGIPFTEEHRDKISASLQGRSFTEEHKANLSKARKQWIETHQDIVRDHLGRFVKR